MSTTCGSNTVRASFGSLPYLLIMTWNQSISCTKGNRVGTRMGSSRGENRGSGEAECGTCAVERGEGATSIKHQVTSINK